MGSDAQQGLNAHQWGLSSIFEKDEWEGALPWPLLSAQEPKRAGDKSWETLIEA